MFAPFYYVKGKKVGPTLIRIRVQEHGRDETHIGVHIARIGRHNKLRCRVRIIRIIILVVGEVRLLLIRIIIACRVIAIRIAVAIIAAANQRVVVIIVVIAAAIAVILLMLGQKQRRMSASILQLTFDQVGHAVRL